MMSFSRKILLALLSLILTIAFIAVTFSFRRQLGWWAFIDLFALFMTVFSWLMSLLIGKMIPHSGIVLSKIAIIFAILFIISLLAEYIAYTTYF